MRYPGIVSRTLQRQYEYRRVAQTKFPQGTMGASSFELSGIDVYSLHADEFETSGENVTAQINSSSIIHPIKGNRRKEVGSWRHSLCHPVCRLRLIIFYKEVYYETFFSFMSDGIILYLSFC